jgi:translocation and assembly module TamA
MSDYPEKFYPVAMTSAVGRAVRALDFKARPTYLVIEIQLILLALLLYLSSSAVIADVSVNGLAGEAQKNVQLTLSLVKEPCQTPEWKIRSLFAKADDEISEALRALGYYHPVTEKTLAFDPKCWQANFTINAGPRTVVSDISIIVNGDARDDPAFKKLRTELLAENGKPLRHDNYEKIKSRLQSLAMERGYLQAGFTEKQLLIDKANNSAQIKLVFDTGQRRVFGEVTVEQDILNPDLVRRFVSFKSGDFYSSEQLAKTHTALSRSGYFGLIDIRPDTEHIRQNRVPVSIKLKPGKKHHYAFGIGYDTDIGLLGSASYKNRRVNRRGHFINANLDIGQVRSTADAEYNIPLDNPVSDFFSFGGGVKREEVNTYTSKSAKLSARLKHAFDNGWKQTLFIDSLYEDFTIGTTANQVFLLVPGGNWLRSVADSTVRPTRGYRLEFNLAGSYKNPVSEVSFAQASAAAVWTHPFPWRARFIGRAEQGATLVDRFDKLPPSYRYFAGGMSSVRGYAYRDLGPRDDLGNIIGGKLLTVVSAEYEHYLFDDWSVAAFIDSGNAYNPGNIRIKTGAGLGVRWYSPIGPIRLDFAVPLSESDSSFQIHFAAGTRL